MTVLPRTEPHFNSLRTAAGFVQAGRRSSIAANPSPAEAKSDTESIRFGSSAVQRKIYRRSKAKQRYREVCIGTSCGTLYASAIRPTPNAIEEA